MTNEEEKLIERIMIRTIVLEDLVRGEIIKPSSGIYQERLKFIIATNWNSWYPSYFEIFGGCYGFVTRDDRKEIDKNAGVTVIDPGFNFSKALRKFFNIEPHDIRKVLISHFHPDHTTGMYELLTLTHESRHACAYHLDTTAYDFFKAFQGKDNKIYEYKNNQVIEVAKYMYKNIEESIYANIIQTFHGEIGNRHNSHGFIFDVKPATGDSKKNCCYAILMEMKNIIVSIWNI